jgi:hypothetical protein
MSFGDWQHHMGILSVRRPEALSTTPLGVMSVRRPEDATEAWLHTCEFQKQKPILKPSSKRV